MASASRSHRASAGRLPVTLIALLIPGVLGGIGVFLLRDHPRFLWFRDLSEAPWEFWLLLFSGLIATAAGIADWRLHRSGKVAVGPKEHHGEVLALVVGGLPLFALMAVASILPRPHVMLVPVIIVGLFTVVLICYDEFVFHRRRCDRYETLLHRLLVFGMGVAWLSWVHWCFVRGAAA
jgi:uncharacterized membrane protein